MTGKQLKNSILQWAIQGKLVPQDPNDEPASVLLERIRAEKARLVKEKKIKKPKNESIIYRGDDNSHYEKFADGTVRCIDDEIPFEIPNSWAWVRLGAIIDFSVSRSIPANEIDNDAWVLDLEDIQKDSGLLICKKRKEHIEIKSDKHIFKKGNVLYSKLRPYLNKVIIADEDGFSTSEILAFDFGHIDNQYAQLYLMSPFFVEYAMSDAYGVKMPRLGSSQGNNGLMPIPPKEEQSRIVNKFQKLLLYIYKYGDIECELTELNAQLYPLLKKSILQEAIQGRIVAQDPHEEPASVLLERIRAEKAQLFKEKKIKRDKQESVIFRGDDNCYYEQIGKDVRCIQDEIPFEIPSNWIWVRLKTVLNIWSARRVHEKDWRNEGIPFYRAREIGRMADNGCADNELYIDESLYKEFSRSGLPNIGDLMMTAVGTLGKCYIVVNDEPFYFKDGSVLCIGNFGKINPKYLNLFFQSDAFISRFIGESQGTTVATLTMIRLNEYLLPLPPIEEQQRIVAKIEQLFQMLK